MSLQEINSGTGGTMADFNPQETYQKAVGLYNSSRRDTDQKEAVLAALYAKAAARLGYDNDQLAYNRDCQLHVAKFMFSDEIAGNPLINTRLKSSPLYAGWSQAKDYASKQHMHRTALGINHSDANGLTDAGKLDWTSSGFSSSLSRYMASDKVQPLISLLETVTGITEAEKRQNLAKLATQDPLIAGLKTGIMDHDQIRNIVVSSVMGNNTRHSLENTVGVEVPKYKWN